jgi:hypothetical protein
MELTATVRLGQSAGALLGGDVPGTIAGTLQFSGDTFDGATFLTTDNQVLTVTGGISGSATTIRLVDQSGNVWVLVGAGEQSIATCTGRVDGLFTGPLPGDIGDWHGTLSAQPPAEGGAAAPTAAAPDAAAPAPAECINPAEPCTGAVPCCFGLTCLSGNCRVLLGQPCEQYFPLPGLLTEAELCEPSPPGDSVCAGVCQSMATEPPLEPPPCAETGASCAVVDCCLGYCTQDFVCECVGTGDVCAGVGTGGCCSGQPCDAGICP